MLGQAYRDTGAGDGSRRAPRPVTAKHSLNAQDADSSAAISGPGVENNEINKYISNQGPNQALNAGFHPKEDLSKNYVSSDNLFKKGMQIQANHKKFWPSGSLLTAAHPKVMSAKHGARMPGMRNQGLLPMPTFGSSITGKSGD